MSLSFTESMLSKLSNKDFSYLFIHLRIYLFHVIDIYQS